MCSWPIAKKYRSKMQLNITVRSMNTIRLTVGINIIILELPRIIEYIWTNSMNFSLLVNKTAGQQPYPRQIPIYSDLYFDLMLALLLTRRATYRERRVSDTGRRRWQRQQGDDDMSTTATAISLVSYWFNLIVNDWLATEQRTNDTNVSLWNIYFIQDVPLDIFTHEDR